MLGEFCAPDDVQLNLFGEQPDAQRSASLMYAIDTLNRNSFF